MNVMLVGGASPMMRKLSLKLYKEGHRIYVLSGNKNPSDRYQYSFERYDISYSSDSVKEVIRSVNPDVTVLLGAFDSNFHGSDSRKDAVEHIAGIQNILLSWASTEKGRLIYLSSAEVYGNSYQLPISEEIIPIPSGIRATTILQAEESCRFYQERMQKDIIIARIDKLYDIPQNKHDVRLGICESKCFDAFRDGIVTYKKNYKYGLTYMGDVIESIYKLIACEKHDYNMYNISSGKAFSEFFIVESIEQAMQKELEKIDITSEEQNTVVLANQRFSQEFGFDVRHAPEQVIQMTINYMKRHSSRFLDSEHQGTSLWQRIYYKIITYLGVWFPYIENLILFIPFFMLNNRATDSRFFSKIDFYLIYVLLFSVVHGQRQATFSALLATAGYIFRQMYNNTGIEVLSDYNTYVWIAEIFILGLVVGYLKDQINFLKEEQEQEVSFLSERVTDITDINDSNLRVKEGLITQVVNYNYSLGTVYDMIEKLGDDDPVKILFRAITLVKNVTGCSDVSIYRFDDENFAYMFGHTSEKSASMGNVVNISDKPILNDTITRNIVYLNREMNPEYPMMAYAVYENDKPNMMIMLWSVPFERMTINESNRLIVLAKLIRKSLRKVEEHYEIIKNERMSDNGKVLKQKAFSELIDTYREAEKKNMANYILLKVVSVASENQVSVIYENIHKFDYMGYGKDGELYILLTNADEERCESLKVRLNQCGVNAVICGESEI